MILNSMQQQPRLLILTQDPAQNAQILCMSFDACLLMCYKHCCRVILSSMTPISAQHFNLMHLIRKHKGSAFKMTPFQNSFSSKLVYMSSSFWLLTVAEKKITACRDEQIHNITTIFTQNNNNLGQFWRKIVTILLRLENKYSFFNLRYITRSYSQKLKDM